VYGYSDAVLIPWSTTYLNALTGNPEPHPWLP
jgi:hypothetical protein